MAVSLRDFLKAIYALYLITIATILWDLFQKGFTMRALDMVKAAFFGVLTVIIALFLWFSRE